jgi:hypothetical protein
MRTLPSLSFLAGDTSRTDFYVPSLFDDAENSLLEVLRPGAPTSVVGMARGVPSADDGRAAKSEKSIRIEAKPFMNEYRPLLLLSNHVTEAVK